MSGGFYRAEVVSGGDGDRIDTVHDALVVGSRAVRIHQGQVGQYDPIPDCCARVIFHRKVLYGDTHPRPDQRPVGQIGQDPQEYPSTGDGLDQAGHTFAHAVDDIGAHGIAGIHEQVHDEHVALRAFRVPALRRPMVKDLDVPGTTAPGNHLGVQAVGQVDDLVLALKQGLPGERHIGHVDNLHLADEKRVGDLGHVAAGQPGGPGRSRQPRDHRQAEYADHVLDHLVRQVELQRMRARVQRGKVFLGQRSAITKRFDARSDAQLEEIRDSRPRLGRRDIGCH